MHVQSNLSRAIMFKYFTGLVELERFADDANFVGIPRSGDIHKTAQLWKCLIQIKIARNAQFQSIYDSNLKFSSFCLSASLWCGKGLAVKAMPILQWLNLSLSFIKIKFVIPDYQIYQIFITFQVNYSLFGTFLFNTFLFIRNSMWIACIHRIRCIFPLASDCHC